MNILVFCSAQRVPEKYTHAAADVATRIAQAGHTLVWGGSNAGTMMTIADAAQAAGGKILGVSMDLFKHKARKNADEMIVTKDLAERKRIMLERSDAVIALAGGIGTLDEVSEVLALKRHGDHTKPVVFLNTDNFFEGLRSQLEKMRQEGFLDNVDNDIMENHLYYFADTPEQAILYIEKSVITTPGAL